MWVLVTLFFVIISTLCAAQTPVEVQCVEGEAVTVAVSPGSEWVLKSPNYPNNYSEFSGCSYNVVTDMARTIRLACKDVELGLNSFLSYSNKAGETRHDCNEEKCAPFSVNENLGVPNAMINFHSCVNVARGYECFVTSESEGREFVYDKDGCRSPPGDSEIADWILEFLDALFDVANNNDGLVPEEFFGPWDIPDQKFNFDESAVKGSFAISNTVLSGKNITHFDACNVNMTFSEAASAVGWLVRHGDVNMVGDFDISGVTSSIFGDISVIGQGTFNFTAEAVRQLAGATVYLDDTSSNVTYQMRDLAINVFKDVVKMDLTCTQCDIATQALMTQGDFFANALWDGLNALLPVATENFQNLVNNQVFRSDEFLAFMNDETTE